MSDIGLRMKDKVRPVTEKDSLFLVPLPAATHGWGAEPQTPLTQPYSQPATFRFFPHIFLLKQSTSQRRADPAGFYSYLTSKKAPTHPTASPSNFLHIPNQTCPLTTLGTHIFLQHSWWTLAGLRRVCHTHQAQTSLVMPNSLHINLSHKHMLATLHWSVLLTCPEGKSKQESQPSLHQHLHWQTEWVFKVENSSFSKEGYRWSWLHSELH